MKAALDALVALKSVDRAGWKRVGVTQPESVADHSYGVALLALLYAPPALDRERLLIMALLHDLAEARVGDLTPYDGVSKAEKHAREAAAMATILAARPDLRAVWEEAEAGESPEARFLKRLDKAELGLQARHYATHGVDVSEFLTSALDGLALLDDVSAR